MKLYYLFLLVFLLGVFADDDDDGLLYYDTFTGEVIPDDEYKEHVESNSTFWCVGSFKKCNASEGRRLDLSCSNLEFPTRGPPHSPYLRELPALFGENNEPVKQKNGEDMPLARKLRQQALVEGDIPDQNFTILFVHYFLFTIATQTSFHDSINYVVWTPYCCKPEGKKDPMCVPHKIPPDDTVHKFSGVRCMNQTVPFTFQNRGCIRNKTSLPQRINSATTFYDLNMVYGFDNSYRSFEDGMLKVDVVDGKIWPFAAPEGQGNCLQNSPPQETRCHSADPINALIGMNFFGILFWRQHNFIAKQLKEVNPCWDDDKIFTIAREINIGYFTQIFFYELLAVFMGKENLIKEGILSEDGGFRKTFKEGVKPELSIEYVYIMRWGHTIMPGLLKMYDSDGNYLKQIPSTNVTLRTGYVTSGDNFDAMTEGSFRQAAGKIDHIVDPIIAETGFGNLQYAFDITMADLAKAGLHGINNYVSFRQLCTGKEYKSFDDLKEDIDPEYIEIIKSSFKNVEDVPLLLGTWLEKPIPGGFAPRTLYCIAKKQYKRYMEYDRHWYEDPDRPNAFTADQLAEVRHMTVARMLCDVGHSIEKITRKAFLRESSTNPIVDCKEIRPTNYTVWKAEC